MGEPLLVADPLQELGLERLNTCAHFVDEQLHLHLAEISSTDDHMLPGATISEVGISVNQVEDMMMERSIFTARSDVLQSMLRKLRIDSGLRQVDLAKRLGQPQSFVSKYESGERRLDLPELQQICDACDISLVEFVQRYEDATRAT